MPSPAAIVGLTVGGYDVQRADLGVFLQISTGLDELPEVRGTDAVVPYVPGRLPRPRLADVRKIVLEGRLAGALPRPRPGYRAYVDEIKALFDPTAGEPLLIVAQLEDGSTRTATAVPRNIAYGPTIGGEYRPASVELEALDPYWYGGFTPLRVAAIGDSILQVGGGGSMHPWQQGSTFFALACWYSQSRLRYWGAWGNSGDTTGAMLARLDTILELDPPPTHCVIEGGTNDTVGQVATSEANVLAMCELLAAAGITPVLTTMVPSASAPDAANNMTINAWLAELAAARGWPLADFWTELATPAGDWADAADTLDGTHPSMAGAEKMARVLVAALVPEGWAEPDLLVRMPPGDPRGRLISTFDYSSASWNSSAPGGGTAVATRDTSDSVEGTASLKLSLAGVVVRGRTWTNPLANLSGGYPDAMPVRLRVKVSTLTNLGYLVVQIANQTGGATREWHFLPSAAGVWLDLEAGALGDPDVESGTLNLATMDKVQVEAQASGGTYTGDVWWDVLTLGEPGELPEVADANDLKGLFDTPGGQGQDADWGRYGVIPAYDMVDDPAISGRWQRLTLSGTGGAGLFRAGITDGWAVGDRLLFSGRVRFAGDDASTLAMGVIFTGADAAETFSPFYAAPAKFAEPVLFAMEREVPAGTTALRMDLAAYGVAGDVVDYAQISLFNITRGAVLASYVAQRVVSVVPTAPVHELDIATGGTAAADRVTITFAGPSVGSPGFEVVLPSGEVVGFTVGAPLASGETLIVDNAARTVQIGFASRRSLMALRSANRGGEYVHLVAGTTRARVLGQPTQAWVTFIPTYL